MEEFSKVVLYTDDQGFAQFREEPIELTEGSPRAMLSALMPSGGYQLRHSPVGFSKEFHCTRDSQFVFILSGIMEISLQDGTSKTFHPGQHFYSSDLLPLGETFDPTVHGHQSRQVGDSPLVTLFLRG
jgi:mannose-6-phosphate isomerase-like protein (cupin superfamily)